MIFGKHFYVVTEYRQARRHGEKLIVDNPGGAARDFLLMAADRDYRGHVSVFENREAADRLARYRRSQMTSRDCSVVLSIAKSYTRRGAAEQAISGRAETLAVHIPDAGELLENHRKISAEQIHDLVEDIVLLRAVISAVRSIRSTDSMLDPPVLEKAEWDPEELKEVEKLAWDFRYYIGALYQNGYLSEAEFQQYLKGKPRTGWGSLSGFGPIDRFNKTRDVASS